MESLANRIIARLTNTRSGERTVALLMFAYSFLVMTSHNILKPVTKSKFIDQLGSDNLPYVLMASSVLVAVVMHGYSGWIRRLPRQFVIPIAQSALVVLLVVLWVLLRSGAVWVTVALYFFGQILGVLLISQFWMLANEVYDARQAKRLFGLIGGGACLGGALGASITAITVEEFGSNNLLLVSAATGQIVGRKADGPLKAKDAERLKAATLPLSQSVRTALGRQPGHAVQAELDSHFGTVVHEVDILTAQGQDKHIGDPWVLVGFGQTMTLAKFMNSLGDDVTSDGIVEQMKAFEGPLILGSPVLECGKYPEAPSVCNDYTQFYKYNGANEWEQAGDFVPPTEGWTG